MHNNTFQVAASCVHVNCNNKTSQYCLRDSDAGTFDMMTMSTFLNHNLWTIQCSIVTFEQLLGISGSVS